MSSPTGEPHYEVSPDHHPANGDAEPAASVYSFAGVDNDNVDMKRYRDLPHRSTNEALKSHTNFSVRLSETGELK